MDTNTFRDYTRSDAVREHYRKLRKNQNPDYVKRMREKYSRRYHSLYPWHSGGAYTELEDENDREMKPIVREFNKYDLYTKRNTPYTKKEIEELRTYYCNLVSKFLPDTIRL